MENKKYLSFRHAASKGKTDVFVIFNGDIYLGLIKWRGSFRKYAFFPEADTVWDSSCLREVIEFCDNLMKERKSK